MAQEAELHLKKIRFTKGLRGYTCEEVDAYLAYVNDRYNTLVRECSDLRKKMTVMAAGQNEYREDALRDKEQIAAAADAMVRQKSREAEELTARAQKKAASMLQEAEKKAAEILRQAEAAAENILSTREAERQAVLQAQAERTLAEARREAGEIIARQTAKAEALVAEMDAFRESVFALYSRHIGELEKLAGDTDALYQKKEELLTDAAEQLGAASVVMPGEEDTEAEEPACIEEEPMPAPAPYREDELIPDEAVFEDAPADTPVEPIPLDDDLFTPAEEWESADVLDDQSADQSADPSAEGDAADDALLKIDWKAHRAAREDLPVEDATEEPEEIWENADHLFTDVEESPAAESASAEPIREDAPISEEDFLTALKDAYLNTPPPKNTAAAKSPASEPAKKPAAKDPTARNGELEDLFFAEGEEVSLTGEFDKIFNSKKSAANVTQISRQPLVPAQKPDKKAAKHLADRNKNG